MQGNETGKKSIDERRTRDSPCTPTVHAHTHSLFRAHHRTHSEFLSDDHACLFQLKGVRPMRVVSPSHTFIFWRFPATLDFSQPLSSFLHFLFICSSLSLSLCDSLSVEYNVGACVRRARVLSVTLASTSLVRGCSVSCLLSMEQLWSC